MFRRLAAAALVAATTTQPVFADAWGLVPDGTAFQRVADRTTFVRIMSNRALKRFGINLEVRPDGQIDGNAFGRDVSGAWQWREGYFCRELAWGRTRLAPNCQEVKVAGSTVRFTSDRGSGAYADLRLR